MWRRTNDENDVANPESADQQTRGICRRKNPQVDEDEEHDRVVATKPTVCDDTTDPGSDVEPEAVELRGIQDMTIAA